MKIEGKVATIIFRNEKNLWTVMLLKVGKDYVTAVGEIEDIEVDDEIELEGVEDTHKVYGTQFKFSTYKKVLPKTNAALIQYIADNIHGVGKKTARNIVEEFGEETVNVIRFNPDKLASIKGLNDEKIENLYTFFNEEWEKWNTIEYLSKFSISAIVANKIYQALGKDTIAIVKENPYSLLSFVKALDFNTVDEIGKNMGVSLYNEDRLDNGVIYAINKITDFGHTCVEKENLLNYSATLLKVGINDVLESVNRLCDREKLFIQEIDNEDFVFRSSYYLAEENIAKSIAKHLKKKIKHKKYEKEIEKVSEKNSLVLSDEQKEVIKTSLNSCFSVITGGPGTGKTTIIKCIIDILEDMEKEYVLCAPTGRAAKRITETTGKEAKTLHRLLEIIKLDDKDIDSFLEYEVKQVEADVVIVDEASMIDCMMMNNLLKGIKPTTQIIIVGDVNQLPSVGPGSVLKDIIDSKMVEVSYLKHIYRQSAESDIIVNAHKVNSGEHPIFKNKNTDLFFIQTNSIDDTIQEITSLVSYRLETFAKFDILKDLQILTPTKKTELGTVQLNTTIQNILNPKSLKKNEKEVGDKIFREGDKIMQIVNNYDKKFCVDGNHFEGIYNGDIGYIQNINTADEKMTILFDDDRLVDYDFDELEEIEHAYAVTIHKSQGSEFDYVILPLYTGYAKLLTRNLLYTAMTRAKKMLIIVGNRNVLNYMVDNTESKNRRTGLKYKIIDEVNKIQNSK